MAKLASLLAALALVLGVVACGSSSSNSTPGRSTATSTTAAQPAPGASHPQAKAKSQKAAARAQKLVGQVASATGRLAAGNSPSEQAARSRLAQLQRQSNALASSVARKLAPSNPARTLIVQASRQVAQASARLQRMQLTASTRQALYGMQGTLERLSAAIGQINGSGALAGAATIAGDLQKLQRQLSTQASGRGSGA